MPTWLSDPTYGFYIIALILALVGVGLWYRSRDKGSAYRAGILVGALVLVGIIDLLVESPREQSVRKVNEISKAINERNSEKFLANVSDDFDSKGKKKADLAKIIELAKQFDVTTAVWDFNRNRAVISKDGSEVELVFEAKAEGKDGVPFQRHIKATLVKGPDGQYRLKGFTPYNFVNKGEEEPIPGF